MSLKRHDFAKKNACQQRSSIVTKTKGNRHFDEAITAIQMVQAFINGDYDPASVDDVKKDVEVSYSEENIDDVKETQDSNVNVLSKSLFRFINSFPWCYGKPDDPEQKIFVPEDPIYLDLTPWLDNHDTSNFEDCDDIEVRFTWIRKDVIESDERMNVGTLEGAILRKGKPDIGATARSRSNVNNDLWLHIMRHALRRYADTFLKEGQSINIEATYYFLRKKEKSTDAYELEDYFRDSDGIRKQKEIYTKMKEGLIHPDNDLDGKFREEIEKFVTGYEKCDLKEDTDCKGCPNYLSCYYKEPPILRDDESAVGTLKARGSIEQDEYQKVVTSFRHGTGIVDAPPGSGKTEITTERTVQMAFEILNDLVERYEFGEDVEVPVTAQFRCKSGDGDHAEVLINGKPAAQNWAEIEEESL